MYAGYDSIVTKCHKAAVTFRDVRVNAARQAPTRLCRMNTKTLTLLLILFMASAMAADQPTLRYSLAGTLQLHMAQVLYPDGREKPIADRRIDMTIEFAEGEEASAKLADIKATYTAHGMQQILSTRHLVGQPVALGTDGRSVSLGDPGGDIDLGSITDGGLYPSSLLVDVLPVLPDGPVSKGMSWEITQPVRSLEGWAWAEGTMHYSNEVVDIRQHAGHTVVHVQSQGETNVDAAAGTKGYLGMGTLKRRLDWIFDADTGRLLSLSLEQESNGANRLPQGRVEVRQQTIIELRGS
jgi:hypothetical protein